MIGPLFRDLRQALRVIRKTPVVTAIAVVSLALGIAACATIFSLVNSFLLRPLPYPDADRLVMVWENPRAQADDSAPVAPANFFDWRERAGSFEELVAASFGSANLTGLERPAQLTVARVTPGFFRLVGTAPIRGRTFRDDEGGREDAPVAVINERLWRGRFGAAEDLVGREVILDGDSHTVVGVLPETFDFIVGSVDLWIAADFDPLREERGERTLVVTGRLRDGVSVAAAQAEMNGIGERLEKLYPATNEGYGVYVESVRAAFPGPTDTLLVQILLLVVLLVLLVACVNVASLLLATAEGRHKEMAVRVALGAGKGRLLRQLLTESLVLAVIAGALGTLLAVAGVKGLGSALPSAIPAFYAPRFDAAVLGFSAAISLLSGLVFGVSPALQAVAGNLVSTLIEGSRGGTASRGRKRLLSAFVVVEIALALTILIGAAVLTDLFHQRLGVDPGFDPEGVLTMELNLPEHRLADDAALAAFVEEAERGLAAVPGVDRRAVASQLPRAWGLPSAEIAIAGETAERNEAPRVSWLAVSPDYFATMGTALRAGRGFNAADRAGAPPVAVVNQRLVELHFADGQGAIGRRLMIDGEEHEIVGVAPDVAQTRLAGVVPHDPTVYLPFAQRPVRGLYVVLRSAADPRTLAEPAQRAIWAIDPDQPIAAVKTLEEHVAEQLSGPDVIAKILAGVGLLTLVLAAIGIYGIMAFSVSRQTNEIGIRMALGARPGQILSRVTRQGAVLAGLGLLLGVPASGLVVRLIGGLFEAAERDGMAVERGIAALPIVEVSVLLAAVGLLACYLPARRATRVDPVTALQHE